MNSNEFSGTQTPSQNPRGSLFGNGCHGDDFDEEQRTVFWIVCTGLSSFISSVLRSASLMESNARVMQGSKIVIFAMYVYKNHW